MEGGKNVYAFLRCYLQYINLLKVELNYKLFIAVYCRFFFFLFLCVQCFGTLGHPSVEPFLAMEKNLQPAPRSFKANLLGAFRILQHR